MSLADILSERLVLTPMGPEFLRACLGGERDAAEEVLGASIPDEWLQEQALMQIRLDQLEKDPSLLPWLLRAMVDREKGVMVGHIGFHSRPGPEYLKDYAPGGVEFGYTVFAEYRRQGYAREAVAALIAWAVNIAGVARFVVSISPDNLPSQRLAQSLGFQKIGEFMDPEDGLEEIFELRQDVKGA